MDFSSRPQPPPPGTSIGASSSIHPSPGYGHMTSNPEPSCIMPYRPYRSQNSSGASYNVLHPGERAHHVVISFASGDSSIVIPAVHVQSPRARFHTMTNYYHYALVFAALTFILNRHIVIPFLSCLVLYPQLVALAAHIPTLGLILYYIDLAKNLNAVSLTSDLPNIWE